MSMSRSRSLKAELLFWIQFSVQFFNVSSRHLEFFQVTGQARVYFPSCLEAACSAQGWPIVSRLRCIRYSIWFIPFLCSENKTWVVRILIFYRIVLLFFAFAMHSSFCKLPSVRLLEHLPPARVSLRVTGSSSLSCDYLCTGQSLWTSQSEVVIAFITISEAYWTEVLGQGSSLLVAVFWE